VPALLVAEPVLRGPQSKTKQATAKASGGEKGTLWKLDITSAIFESNLLKEN